MVDINVLMSKYSYDNLIFDKGHVYYILDELIESADSYLKVFLAKEIQEDYNLSLINYEIQQEELTEGKGILGFQIYKVTERRKI